MTDLPAWLQVTLIEQGVMTKDRVTKHAHPRRCQDCGLYTLTGLDDLLPKVVHADLLPTTTVGELTALMSGRRTFGLDHGEFYIRTAGRIGFRAADHTQVHAEHSCGSPPLPVNPKFMPARFKNPDTDVIPF
jgi:hypothetical protein